MFSKKPSLAEARADMVNKQLIDRHITDARVLEAMREIPRHLFVDRTLWDSAYKDRPLPIGFGQTISQPYIVAFMTQALQLPVDGQGMVLEIGTGSGYQAAILSRLAAQVYSIERVRALADRTQLLLKRLGIENVKIKVGDGGYGWPEYAPYDAIVTTAAAPELPAPLKVQLKDRGRLVAPVGPRGQQDLLRLQRQGDRLNQEKLAPVAFVPLIGEHGWEEDEDQ
jgi:protein-L-isoaspartate(D-aspartate) O-methyltransferase